ncbi:MAG TPA: serpin family protein [Bacteroidales bacterium]|nr:serpin family protein [Bacteroidales bacterium]
MKSRYFFIAIILILSVISSCKKDNDSDVKEIKLSTKQKEIVVAGNEFSLGLFQKVSETTDDNFMISPLSVNYALAMTANGAKNNTQDQMLTTLGFEGFEINEFNEFFHYIMDEIVDLDSKVTLSIANSIWYRNTFNIVQSFLDVNQEYYNAHVQALNFDSPEAISTINDWVSDNTNDKIPTIIDNIPTDAIMYLINAVYFYGKWRYEFDNSQTQNGDFYISDNNSIQVEMMKMEAGLKYYFDESVNVVELPYGQGNFVMDILLPVYESNPADLIANLDQARWTEITQGLYDQDILLTMPKFQFEFENDLIPMLSELGMTDLFNPNMADLSGINGTGGLFVSKVKHKTYIDVTEKGTEAAAVTAVEVSLTSGVPDGPVYFTCDRPFVFIIRERSTEVILFTGVVKNP